VSADARRTLSTALDSDGVTPAGLVMEQRLVVPFGTDPVVVSQTIITNNSPRPISLSYYEVWGGSTYQMAYGQTGNRRTFQQSNYTASVQPLADFFGVASQQTYTGPQAADTPPFTAPGATLWDESPPLTFLVNAYEHDVTTDTGCSASAFFGAGKDPTKPAFGMRCEPGNSSQSDAALVLRRNVSYVQLPQFAFTHCLSFQENVSR
jgi:hypothetical protein